MRMQSIPKSPTNVHFNYGGVRSYQEPYNLPNRETNITFTNSANFTSNGRIIANTASQPFR